MSLLNRRRDARRSRTVVQTAPPRTFLSLEDTIPLQTPDTGLYQAMREAVPLIDGALDKIVRLTGAFHVRCSDPSLQEELDHFVENIPVGACSRGLDRFVSVYLDSLLTCGNAVGEMIPNPEGTDLLALYNARLADVRIRRGATPLEVEFCTSGNGMDYRPVTWPDLILFTPLAPQAGEISGTPLLRSLPFVTDVLLKIFHSTGTNFDRVANLRYAVTYKPGNDRLEKAWAGEIAEDIAKQWGEAMAATKSGDVRDFVAVGDVDIRVIGADNQMLNTEVPVRQMLEQIVARLGVPPFMLGLHWSSTERMSTQQADILTSELESYRMLLSGVIRRICDFRMHLRGHGCTTTVLWDDINLQDEVETARARLTLAQAMRLEESRHPDQRKEESH